MSMRPNLNNFQQKILTCFYDLRREVASGHRIKSVDIKEYLKKILVEEDYGLLVIQMVDDFYLDLYTKALKSNKPI